MRKTILLAAALLAIMQPARAQFCPGVSPWVFDDVAASDSFCGYITWMAENGITLGCQTIDANHRLYCPNATVTRAAMAAFMNRLGNVRVEAVDTGPGLTGGPITSVGTIGLAATQLLPTTACANNQIPRWNGSAWACSNDASGGGTVTSVGSGTGLTGGPITASGALSIATGYQLPQGCTNGQLPKSNGAGGWTCGTDVAGTGTVTSVATGAGLTGGPVTTSGTLSADTTYLQRRVSAACTAGSSVRAIAQDGTVTCQPPANPTEIYVPADGAPLANGAALAAAVAAITDSVAKGYVIRLSRGTYEMAAPLVLADGIALQGSGAAQTTVLGNGIASVVSMGDTAHNELRDLKVHSISASSTVAIRALGWLRLDRVGVLVESSAAGSAAATIVGVGDDLAVGATELVMSDSDVSIAFTGSGTAVTAVGVGAYFLTIRDSSVAISGAPALGTGLDVPLRAIVRHGNIKVGSPYAAGVSASALRIGGLGGDYELWGTSQVHDSSLAAYGSPAQTYAISVNAGGAFDAQEGLIVSSSRLRANLGSTSLFRPLSLNYPIIIAQSQWDGANHGGLPMRCFGNYNSSYVPTNVC